jgi:hypothetical protein
MVVTHLSASGVCAARPSRGQRAVALPGAAGADGDGGGGHHLLAEAQQLGEFTMSSGWFWEMKTTGK